MYSWVALGPEADRLDFVQQALSLAIVNNSDVPTAAGPALRTAKSLYELSRRGSVAEAMAARRAARDAAIGASRGAASAARETAAKVIERTVLQVIAAAGVIIAQLKSALSTPQAIGLLVLIAALCVSLLVVTLLAGVRSARDGLNKELADLDQYRDSLSQDDIDSIKRAGVIGSARADLKNACTTAWLAYGLATVVALIAAGVLGFSSSAAESPKDHAPSPTPTEGSSPSTTPTSSSIPPASATLAPSP